MTAEHVLILYEGTALAAREINELVRVVERETGVDLLGVRELLTRDEKLGAAEVA